MIPLCRPCLDKDEVDRVSEILLSGWLAHGSMNHEFEKKFAKFIGVKRAVTLNSCTSALFLALKALEITGDVLIPSFSFVATANAIVTAGARPRFVDIRRDTRNIDATLLEAALTENTEAIMPVHYGGQCCDMEAIAAFAKRHGLALIEDSAETIGGTFDGLQAGSFGIGCFSFFPTKNIATGEGGMLTTNDDALADRVALLSAHGVSKARGTGQNEKINWYRAAVEAGYNFRMCNVLAAIGSVQMDKIESFNTRRRAHAAYLTEKLSAYDEIETPVEVDRCEHVYQMYTILLDHGTDRDQFVIDLQARGIGASVHFDPPIHLQPYYVEMCPSQKLPVTEDVARRIVTLPMYPHLTQSELDEIVNAVGEVLS